MKLEEIAEKHGLTPEGIDYALTQYQIVICEITHGMLSKLSYDAKDIIRVARERWHNACERKPILLENQHKPYGISTNANSPWISRCPRCGKKIEGKQTKFCKYCGQAVRWE